MTKAAVRKNKNLINRETFALRMRALRRDKGMTQTELAARLNVARSSIANWEKGIRFPSSEYVEQMARLFGVPMDYLYGMSNHRYNINVPDYFELDLTKLNSRGVSALYDYYKLLLKSDEHTK